MKKKNQQSSLIKNINFMDPKIQSCPYESYKNLRAECPVYKMPDLGFYMITKYKDGRQILLDTKKFSNKRASIPPVKITGTEYFFDNSIP